jgi:hypothetical protein
VPVEGRGAACEVRPVTLDGQQHRTERSVTPGLVLLAVLAANGSSRREDEPTVTPDLLEADYHPAITTLGSLVTDRCAPAVTNRLSCSWQVLVLLLRTVGEVTGSAKRNDRSRDHRGPGVWKAAWS